MPKPATEPRDPAACGHLLRLELSGLAGPLSCNPNPESQTLLRDEIVEKQMASANQYPGIDPDITACVRHYARRMTGTVAGMDIEDLEQALMLQVHRRLHAYDPNRARLRTFVDRILRSHCAQLLEATRAVRRGRGRSPLPLTCLRPGATAENEDHEAEREIADRDEEDDQWERVDLRCDVDRAVAALPEHLAHCCRWLSVGSATEAARHGGLARGSIHSRMITIRRHFIDAGLDAYLARPARQFGDELGM